MGDISYHFDRVNGPTVVMVVKPYEPLPERYYTEGIARDRLLGAPQPPLALDPAIKSCNLLNNILAVREAQARGALEPILLNQDGEVAEGASSNVFVVKDGGLLTPPLEAGILRRRHARRRAGAARRSLGLPVREEDRARGRPAGRGRGLRHQHAEGGLPRSAQSTASRSGSGRPGPVTLRLLRAYREYAARAVAERIVAPGRIAPCEQPAGNEEQHARQHHAQHRDRVGRAEERGGRDERDDQPGHLEHAAHVVEHPRPGSGSAAWLQSRPRQLCSLPPSLVTA